MELYKVLRENVNTEHPCHEIPDEIKNEVKDTKTLEEKLSRVKTLAYEITLETQCDLLGVTDEDENELIVENAMRRYANLIKLQSNLIESAINTMEKEITKSEEEIIDTVVPENEIVNTDNDLPEIRKEKEEAISESISNTLKRCVMIAEGQVFGKSVFGPVLESLDDQARADIEIEGIAKLDDIENNDAIEVISVYENCMSRISLLESSFGNNVSVRDIKALCLENFKAFKKNLYALREAEEDVEKLIKATDDGMEANIQEGLYFKSSVVFNKRVFRVLEHAMHLSNLIEANINTAKKYIIDKRY